MFSPDATPASHNHSLRPKRTRQAGQDDSIKPPRAKKQRSALRKDTFEPLADASLNEVAGRRNGSLYLNGYAQEPKPVNSTPDLAKTLTLRGGRQLEKRSDRGNGALLLSSNDFYMVAQLPALPDQLRKHINTPCSSLISPDNGYALALTKSDVLIWSYNSSSSTISSRDIFSFELPFQSETSSDSLPLASFTSRPAGGEPGLVIVAPNNGKIAYWETINNASSFVPGQASTGVQGSVPGLFSGEKIIDIVNAEPAGFILTSSHGRVAHLTVRDQMGRPGVGVQFMRRFNPGAGAGIFGSIRNAFGGDRRKGVAAVRAGKSSKGQRDIVIATEDGMLEFWSTNLMTGNTMTYEITVKEDILNSLDHNLPEDPRMQFQFKVLDFNLGFLPSEDPEIVRQGDEHSTPIVLLAALSHQNASTYYIIELTVAEDAVSVKVVHQVKCYKAPISESSRWRPRLCIPKPHYTAFILFETALVLFSLAKVEESPSSQLLMERHALPDPFQDTIKFQDDTIFKVLGFSAENCEGSNKHPACVVAVQGFGLVRVTSLAPEGIIEDPDEAKVTLKSKIEQAVFFGTMRQNPLDLSRISDSEFSQDEIEEAALEISSEILRSASKFIPKMTPSLDQQLKLRAKALEDLALHLDKHYTRLSRATRWRLLWDAEKLAGAQAMWKVQGEIQKRQPKDRDVSYLEYVIMAIHDDRKTVLNRKKGEKDRIRHWFVHDANRPEHLTDLLLGCFKDLEEELLTDPTVIADYRLEANELWTALYDAALRFREDNAPVYGLGDDVIRDGILTTGYADLPGFWTSTPSQLHEGEQLIKGTCDFLKKWWNQPGPDQGEAPPRKSLVQLAQRLLEQVEVMARLLLEDETRVAETSVDDEERENVKEANREVRNDLLRSIAKFDNYPGAIAICEKHGDTGLLVRLNTDYLLSVNKVLRSPDSTQAERAAVEAKMAAIRAHAESYYETFGERWAKARYSQMILDGDLAAMLEEAQTDAKKQTFLTKYLRDSRKYGKIEWINDVVGQGDFLEASRTLERVAETQESDLWNKKTEVALAKLAGLAAVEVRIKRENEGIENLKRSNLPVDGRGTECFDAQMRMMAIQETVSDYVAPSVRNAIDEKAACEIAMEVFGKRVVAKKPALKGVLNECLAALLERRVLRAEELVDLLTLIDPLGYEGDLGITGLEFKLALDVVGCLRECGPEGVRVRVLKEALQKTIWRRCMGRDDWMVLNETAAKADEEVESEMTKSALFVTLVECARDALNADKESTRLWTPEEVANADPFPEVQRRRFKESERESMTLDLEREQAVVGKFVEEARLGIHFEGLVAAAREWVRREADREGERMAAKDQGEVEE